MTRKSPPEPPEDLGLTVLTPNEWLPIWDRVITSTPTKAVGYAAATRFAGWGDGAEIRPGNVILAKICGCSTKSVERAFIWMRDKGLVWRYHKGACQGDADVYRLTMPEDAFSRIPLLTLKWDYPPDTGSGADTQSGADAESAPNRAADR